MEVQPTGPAAQPAAPLGVEEPADGRIPRPAPGLARELPAEPPGKVEEHLVSLLNPASFEAEQYRTLRHMVEQKLKDTGLRVLAVTSPAIGDGKTTTAINLSGALAQSPEARVLLVDADLRRPSVGNQLGLTGSDRPGLLDAVLDLGLALADVMRRPPPFNLSVLPAGRPSITAPYEVLKSPRLGELLEEARQRYDHIVLDTPPLVPIPDCLVLSKWVDGFLLVVEAHKTPRRLVEEALNVMDPAKVVGLVFNKADHRLSGCYGYYYGHDRSRGGGRVNWWGRLMKNVGRRLWLGPSSRPGTAGRA